jgi:dihydroxyacetone kinase-like predicted kinase
MAKCPRQLPTLSDGEAGTVLTIMKQWAGQYHDCATRHNGLVDAIRTAE